MDEEPQEMSKEGRDELIQRVSMLSPSYHEWKQLLKYRAAKTEPIVAKIILALRRLEGD